jgi:hypothetical protein
MNIVLTDGTVLTGSSHPCGARWAYLATSNWTGGYLHPCGAMVIADNASIKGVTRVTAVGTALSGTLTAPTLALTTALTDMTPNFSGNVTDPTLNDILALEWSTDSFSTLTGSSSNVLEAGEISVPTVEFVVGTLPAASYEFRLRHSRAGWTDGVSAVVSAALAPAAAAPVLTSATDVTVSQTRATISVTTDNATGTLYYVVTTSTTQPSSAQIKAGQNHLGAAASASGSSAISSVGTKSFDITGLTANTQYYVHFIHTNSGATDSNRISGDGFITGLADTYITSGNGGQQFLTAATATYDFTTAIAVGSADSRRRLTLSFRSSGGTAQTHTAVTLYPTALDRTNGTNGTAMTLRGGTGTAANTASTNFISLWDCDLPTGTSYYVRLTCSAASARAVMYGITHSRPWSGNQMVQTGDGNQPALAGVLDVPLSGLVWMHAGCTSGSAITTTLVGVTEQYDALVSGTVYDAIGFHQSVATPETDRAVSSTWTAGSNHRLLVGAYGASA